MTNSKELFNELFNQVRLDETRDEICSIIYLLLENKFGLTKVEVMTGKEIEPVKLDYFKDIIQRINRHEPIQYVLGKAEFYGRGFAVDGSVLIPRPETELLIRAVLKEKKFSPTILDIGTGSGCIAITLAVEIPSSEVYAIDISEEALTVAQQNSKNHKAKVNFSKFDILANEKLEHRFDIIVSNPPYIAESEKKEMNSNVLDFEPPLALFVTDKDPLVFYKAIARKGKSLLKPGGKIFVEINERFGNELKQHFRNEGYSNVSIEKDINNKDRILMAELF